MASPELVETRWGKLRGRRRGQVVQFLGIPYARPPVGERRFAAPEPPEPWSGVRPAHRFGPLAPQFGTEMGPAGKLFRLIRGPIGEDCLYLNVWTPAAPGERRPVMVWIHGGAFVLGAGSTFVYAPPRLVERGVVVVTLNYRLGALGFLDLGRVAPEASIPANLGLRDQLAALAWVRENIGAFGGDPENVTLFGESAGAMSIACLLAMPTHPFRRAILESGAAAHVSEPEQAEFVARWFLDALGLEPRQWRELRRLSTHQILRAQRSALGAPPERIGRLPWQPTLDGELLDRQPLESIGQGAAANLELLIGTNREEWKLFAAPALHLRAMGPTELERRTAALLEASGRLGSEARRAIRLYREAENGDLSPYEIWIALRSDEYFRIPALRLAEEQSRQGAGTFAYRFDFPTPALPDTLGACHGIELPLVFGTLDHPLFRPLFLGSSDARRLSAAMREAWVTFAATGAPGAVGLPSWQPYEPARRGTLLLDRDSALRSDPGAEARRFWTDGTG